MLPRNSVKGSNVLKNTGINLALNQRNKQEGPGGCQASELLLSGSPLGLPARRVCCHLGSDRESTGKSQAGGRHPASSGRWLIIAGMGNGIRMEFSDGRGVQNENVSLSHARTDLIFNL